MALLFNLYFVRRINANIIIHETNSYFLFYPVSYFICCIEPSLLNIKQLLCDFKFILFLLHNLLEFIYFSHLVTKIIKETLTVVKCNPRLPFLLKLLFCSQGVSYMALKLGHFRIYKKRN